MMQRNKGLGMSATRRGVMAGALSGGIAGLGACDAAGGRRASPPATFAQGVASGDPAMDSVVIWTRAAADGTARGVAEVAADADFARVVWSAPFEAGPGTDHTVKLVADGLSPGTRYHYRFRVGEDASPTGRTRTLPERAARARFAVMSCSNVPFGHFHAYDDAARQDVDAVIHLGDYLYEYGPEGYGGEVGARIGRTHEPPRETLTLNDYRARHRQYKSDPGARALHAAHPMIAAWDDHETANDSWRGGAQNHQADEGPWAARRRAALQAYYEYMPVRDPAPGGARDALWREYRWGGLLTLAMVETRLAARVQQLSYADAVARLTSAEAVEAWRREVLDAPDREMMGAAQAGDVARMLAGSAARGEAWQLVGNQVVMARVAAPNLTDALTERDLAEIETQWPEIRAFAEFTRLGLPLNMDAWDGYPAARERFYASAASAEAAGLVVLTGDTHEFWANELSDASGARMGVEIGTTGVTSPGPSALLGERASAYSDMLRVVNPEVAWHGAGANGYVDLTLTEDGGRADFVAVSDVRRPGYTASVMHSVQLVRSASGVRFG